MCLGKEFKSWEKTKKAENVGKASAKERMGSILQDTVPKMANGMKGILIHFRRLEIGLQRRSTRKAMSL